MFPQKEPYGMETVNIQPSLLMIKWGPVGNSWLRQADLEQSTEGVS